VRDEQARRTRRAIVIAAHDLFLAQGYAATTIDGIAEAAHVSRRTVFIRYLASLDGLAVGITEQRAAELCWAVTDGHLYRLLVAQRSWSTADFNRWLSGSLAAALLPT